MLQLANIIRIQNETITLLENVLADRSSILKFPDLLPSQTVENTKIADLMSQLQQLQNDIKANNLKRASSAAAQQLSIGMQTGILESCKSNSSFLIPKEDGLKKECSMKYGENTSRL